MPTKGTIFIVVISLCFVLTITLTFMLLNSGIIGAIPYPEINNPLIISEVPQGVNKQNDLLIETEVENIEINEIDQVEKELEEEVSAKEEINLGNAQNYEGNIEGNIKGNLTQKSEVKEEKNLSESVKPLQHVEKREDKHLNQRTTNTNILCLGIQDKELEMVSIYSINKENKKSAGIFLPTYTTLKVNGELCTLKEIYNNLGILSLKKILAQCLEIDIPYHMVADKQGLVELSELIGPIYVENENIDVPNLFVKPVSDKDDEILQEMAKKIAQPRMVLQVPKLIKIFMNNVQSDIGISGLWDLYRVFSNLNHSELEKIVLWGEKFEMAGTIYFFIDPYDWHNVVYEMTN